ncbi:hypothetical protein NWP22_15030 [Anabaenopsis tanganyikae CS-531]|uniref:Uncharacterized protein n=1 Tax=Anabaenopsis tanganyikae CS-531 TaxID=2785304 RepID=A0ABT6KGY2_9CYAN|nr:hypothetical protein [Anabaenopsis tanganyikae]MDH6107157.1 hypothetical protein [Anabaenopsis tanganyikae CS-531]
MAKALLIHIYSHTEEVKAVPAGGTAAKLILTIALRVAGLLKAVSDRHYRQFPFN